MAGLLDLFSGRSSDIYGNGLLTPEQRGGLGNIGLLALAGKLGQLAGPSFSPVPDFGAALGQAAGAYGASQEGAGTAALNAILTGQKGRKLEQELDYYKQLGPVLSKLAGGWPGAGGGTGGGEGSGSTGGGAAAPLGAGGGGGGGGTGGWGPHADTVVATLKEQGFSDAAIQGILANGLAEGGFASPWVAGDSGNSLGHWQFNNRGEMPGYLAFVKEQGGNPQDTRMQALYVAKRAKEIDPNFAQIDDPKKATDIFATQFERYQGAKPGQRYGQLATVQQRLAGGAAPTAAAPAPVGTGTSGFLAPTAPNPLSDADPMLPIARPTAPTAAPAPGAGAAAVAPNQVGRFAGIAPGTPINSRGFPYNPEITDPAVAARVAQSMAAIKQAQQSGAPWYQSREGSGGGGPLAAPPGAGGDPIMSVTSADQAGGGDAPAAPPRAPLPTMGPAGIELPPTQGPLAAPAPAAAAPAAAGPGLLAAPGALPTAPALPRVNPAFDAYARQLAVAAGLVKGAGLPDALSPLLEVFKGSPAYKAQQTIAEKSAAQPFEQAQTLFNKQVEIAGVGPIEAAKLPYALAQAYFKAEQDIRTAGPVAAAQNFERIRADNAAKGIITTKDADGNIKIAIDPDAVKAVTGATITAPRQAEADIARKTTELQQQGERTGSLHPAQLPDGTNVYVDANGIVVNDPRTGKPLTRAEDPAAQAGRTKAAETGIQRAFDQVQSAEEAQFGLQSTARVRPLIDKMIAGPGADARLEFGRILKAAGLSQGDDVVATQTYLINQLDQASRIAKRFGSGAGITERDVENAQKLAGGNAALDKDTLRNILDMIDRTNRRALELQHQGYDRLTDGGKTPIDKSLYKVAIPINTSDHVARLPAGTPVINPNGDRGTVVIDAKGNRSIEPERSR